VAVTLRAALMVSEHVRDEPLHAPPQAWNASPELGSAVSVTLVPAESVVEQVVRPSPQLRPVPVPVPLPVTETLSGNVVGPVEPPPEKFAVTLLSPLIVTVQVAPLELVQPLQLVNEPPEPGVAVSVTTVPNAKSFEHVTPQLIPTGVEDTEPVPVPSVATSSVLFGTLRVNWAVTEVAAVIDTTHVPVPEHPPPDQPVNVEPVEGVAVRVTEVPKVKVVEHVAPQVIPAGLELTEPEPVPVVATVRVWSGLSVNVAVTACAASIVT